MRMRPFKEKLQALSRLIDEAYQLVTEFLKVVIKLGHFITYVVLALFVCKAVATTIVGHF